MFVAVLAGVWLVTICRGIGIMAENLHALAPQYLPGFLPGPDGSDFLFVAVAIMMIAIVLGLGVAYFTLHALPEKMAHKANSTQLQLIGVLTLLALFTHNNMFWVIALLIAAVRLPDIVTPLNSISQSLERMKEWAIPTLVEAPQSEGAAALQADAKAPQKKNTMPKATATIVGNKG